MTQDLTLSAFWLALFAGAFAGGFVMLWMYRVTGDIVSLLFGISALWLAGAFLINSLIRSYLVMPDLFLPLVWWQRSCYAVTVIFILAGVDALVQAHNGQVPHIRRVVRWWER